MFILKSLPASSCFNHKTATADGGSVTIFAPSIGSASAVEIEPKVCHVLLSLIEFFTLSASQRYDGGNTSLYLCTARFQRILNQGITFCAVLHSHHHVLVFVIILKSFNLSSHMCSWICIVR